MKFATDKVNTPFQFTVEWEDGCVWITEENGSGVKYQCSTISSIANIIERYIVDMQTNALFDKARAESIETVDDIIETDDEDLWNSVVEEYEMMEGNRDVY
jgi:hypothetical protein